MKIFTSGTWPAGQRGIFMTDFKILSANTILYCRKWKETVAFYRDDLSLKISFMTDWFVEFQLSETARLSVADQTRSSVKASPSSGLTMALEVDDIESAWETLGKKGLNPTQIKDHPWDARVCYIWDPEGRRIELWQARTA